MRWTTDHPFDTDEDTAPKSISDTEDWPNRNGHLDNPNHIEDECVTDFESEMEQGKCIEHTEFPE